MNQQPDTPSKTKPDVSAMSPLELAEEMSKLQAEFVANPDAVPEADLRRAVEITRALRKTHTGPAKTRTKVSKAGKEKAASAELNLDELFGN